MWGNRTSQQWIAEYTISHQHPANRLCHTIGIPLILIALAVLVASIAYHPAWKLAAVLFVVGMDLPVHRPRL